MAQKYHPFSPERKVISRFGKSHTATWTLGPGYQWHGGYNGRRKRLQADLSMAWRQDDGCSKKHPLLRLGRSDPNTQGMAKKTASAKGAAGRFANGMARMMAGAKAAAD